MSPIFESERIRLTSYTDEDIQQFATWLDDFALQRLVNPGMVLPMDAQDFLDPESWFQADLKSENARIFAIRTTDTDTFIGNSALINLNSVTHSAEIGINLAHPNYRGKGYGSEVMKLTMRYGFEQWNLHRLYLNVFSYNTRAIRLYEKLGFQHEARLRETIFRDGKLYDQLIMGLLYAEWEAHHDEYHATRQ